MLEATATTPLKAVFRFPFQGSNWPERFLIGSAFIFAGFIIPFLPTIFVYGYALQVMRQAIKGQDLTLPAWDDWGKLGIDGLRGMVVNLVYLLPGALVSIGGMAIYFASSFAFPLMMGAAEQGRDETLALTMVMMFFVSFAIMMLSMFLGSLLGLLGTLPLPMATAHFIAQDKLATAFHVREWWRLLRANWLGYLISLVVAAGLIAVLYIALMLAYSTVCLCCLIPIIAAPIGFYLLLVSAALFGQTYRESVTLLEAKSEVTAS
jgi:hypothetical protein